MNKKGFTLIELMIVVAIIAIIAAIAIPGLLRARISANEGSAIGSLRTIATSESQMQGQAQVDQDGDGTGEFGTVGELSSFSNFRVSNVKASPNYISTSFQIDATTLGAQKSGYYFKAFLPGAVTEVANGAAAAVLDPTDATEAAQINQQELNYRVYAWPVSRTTSGNRVFCIDQQAEVFGAANLAPTGGAYTAATAPQVDDAEPTGSVNTWDGVLVKGTGKDTQAWAPTGS